MATEEILKARGLWDHLNDRPLIRAVPCPCDIVEKTTHGTYCAKCGQPVLEAPRPTSYYELLADARGHRWHELVEHEGRIIPLGLPIVLGKVYIGACRLEPEGVWALVRVTWCENCGHWEVAQSQSEHYCDHAPAPITHLSEDVLGTPRLR